MSAQVNKKEQLFEEYLEDLQFDIPENGFVSASFHFISNS